jgi:hypothetical protein
MRFINATEHEIKVLNGDYVVLQLPAAEKSAVVRCAVKYVQVGQDEMVELFTSNFGELINVPPVQEDTMYVCSLIAAQAMRAIGRRDVCSPGELVRYPRDYEVPELQGQPRGCRGLVIG